MMGSGLAPGSALVSGLSVTVTYESVMTSILILQSLTVMMVKCPVGILQSYRMVPSCQQGSKNGRKLLKIGKKEAEGVQKFIEQKIDTKVAQSLLSAPKLRDCQKWQVKS
jgi:hypothetical protein